jgi:transposase-like protein
MMFVDETLIRINGQDHWLWIAYEPNIHSWNKVIYTDGAHWYNNACKWLRLKHILYEVPLKNIMESFIQQIKDRTECFDDHFPCNKEECTRKPTQLLLMQFLASTTLESQLQLSLILQAWWLKPESKWYSCRSFWVDLRYYKETKSKLHFHIR